jgi:histidinol-phosphatase (PHP family)
MLDGSPKAYYELYYNTVVEMSRLLTPSFIAHFDVLTKFCEKYPPLFDTDSAHYRDTALSALDAVRERHEFFEVNVGAVARGYRTSFYPAPFILDRMRELDCKMLITSDCHNAEFLTANFDKAREYLRAHGFDTVYNLTDAGFVGEKI